MRRSNRARDVIFALMLLAVGIAGLLDVRFGTWRPGPGVGSHLVPAVAYWVMIVCSVPILVARASLGRVEGGETDVRVWPILLTVVWGATFFLSVLYIGLVVACFVFLGIAFGLLAPRRGPLAWGIVGAAAISAAAFWVLFTLLAPILAPRQLLF